MNSFSHKQVLILGAGRSGLAAAELLIREGCEVTLIDSGTPSGATDLLADLGVRREFGVDDIAPLMGGATAAVVSPGIPWEHPWLHACRALDIELMAELELGSRFITGNILAITGSLGKSTCTALSSYALNHAGVKAVEGGNFGIPVCELVLRHPSADWYVLEVSSFQLEGVSTFRPKVGLLINLYPNHLDRHQTMARYLGLKMRLFENMGEGDVALVPQTLAHELLWMIPDSVDRKSFGLEEGDFTWQQEGFALSLIEDGAFASSPIAKTWPKENLTCWIAAMQACGVSMEILCQSAADFTGLPHRMESLRPVNGITIINDSKSTCLAASRGAVMTIPGSLHLILGGRTKGEDDLSLKEVLEARKVNVYLIGETADAWYNAWHETVPCTVSRTLDRAVKDGMSSAKPGEIVMLSPGCASFDQFENFEARGNAFKQFIEQWELGLAPQSAAG